VPSGDSMKYASIGHFVADVATANATTLKRSLQHVMQKADEQLMAEYKEGDLAAFETLYERYETPIYRFAYNGCRNESDAREVFQDVWLRVVKSRDSFNPQNPFKAWLYTIARNRLTDGYRRQSKRAPTHAPDSDFHPDPDDNIQGSEQAAQDGWWAPSLTPEQIASASQESDTLHTALHELPEHQREAIMLKHIAGMNLSEIAAVQSEGIETVKSRLRYAMVKLRQHLKELS